jgi:hypothetical protein
MYSVFISNVARLSPIACLALAVSTATAQTPVAWDAAADFGITSNPNGQWTYIERENSTRARTLMSYAYPDDCGGDGLPIACWQAAPGQTPDIGMNISGAAFSTGSLVVPLSVLTLNPADPPKVPVLAWTAPAAGTYRIVGQFQLVDHAATGVRIRVGTGRTELMTRVLHVFGDTAQFNIRREFKKKESLWFAVGPRDSDAGDTTTLDVAVLPLD